MTLFVMYRERIEPNTNSIINMCFYTENDLLVDIEMYFTNGVFDFMAVNVYMGNTVFHFSESSIRTILRSGKLPWHCRVTLGESRHTKVSSFSMPNMKIYKRKEGTSIYLTKLDFRVLFAIHKYYKNTIVPESKLERAIDNFSSDKTTLRQRIIQVRNNDRSDN